jgi:hypothetical protein
LFQKSHTLLKKLLQKKGETKSSSLSFGQERLWFLDQLHPGNPFYNLHAAFYFMAPIDTAIVERVLKEILRRHEVLQTTFMAREGGPVQIIAPALTLTLPFVDLRELPRPEREAEARRLATEEARRPFDLARGPLLRVTLLQLDEEEYVVLVTIHHIISDAWSMGVLIREILALYLAFSAGHPSPLPDLPIQYADFAHWQRQWLRGEVLETQLAYWQQQLSGNLPVLELPTDRPRPSVQTFCGMTHSRMLPRVLSEALKNLSRREGVTLFITLLAAFQTLLQRYTGQDDIIVGSPITNRNRVELEGLIGYFGNVLVLRTDLSGNPSFRQLLGRIREVCLGAYDHQELPFQRLVETLQPEQVPMGHAAARFVAQEHRL